jgi:hypothetical protein
MPDRGKSLVEMLPPHAPRPDRDESSVEMCVHTYPRGAANVCHEEKVCTPRNDGTIDRGCIR